MFAVLVIVLLLQVRHASVATGAAVDEMHRCRSETAKIGFKVTCKGPSIVEQVRDDLLEWKGNSLYSLVITYVNITTLPELLFENITVQTVRITWCGMKSLHVNSLVGLNDLKILDLSRNSLTTVPLAVGTVKALEILHLNRNRIVSLGIEVQSLPQSLMRLVLIGNVISSLHEAALKNMRHLLRISLSENRIKNIPPNFFRPATKLQQVDLRWNLIEDVENLFDGLLELHTLKLDNNAIRNISSLSATNLPSLQTLTLDHNPIDAFTLFGSMRSAVESLSIRNCQISDPASVPFGCIERLRFLKISSNHIAHIDNSSFPKSLSTTNYHDFKTRGFYPSSCRVENSTKIGILLVIDMSNNYVTAINNAFDRITLLERLMIQSNRIENVPDDAFKTNGNLKELNMHSNRISRLGKHAFRGLVSLEQLTLSKNRLISLNGSLSFMPRLRSLRLAENQLLLLGENEFMNLPHLKSLYAENNSISDVRGAFRHLGALTHLHLPGNNLTTIHRASFPKELKLLQLTIERNPITCDCQLSWMYEVPLGDSKNLTLICHGPPWFAGIPFRDNRTRHGLDVWLKDCDQECTCTCNSNDYSRSVKVDCSNRGLRALPKKFPEDTAAIDLSGNFLDTLDRPIGHLAPMLQNLSLTNNLYSTLDWKVLPASLSNLFLQNNSFEHFPIDIVNNLNLSGIWLSGNPWSCECEDYDFRQWAEAHEEKIKDVGNVTCTGGSNQRVSSMLFIHLGQKDLCPSKLADVVSYGIPLLVLLSVCLTATLIYWKRERQFKIWLYAHGLRCVKEYELDRDKLFDVFLSFSSKDSDWAYGHLLPGLEEAGFSVCTYDRNFKGGFLLQDIIREAVACSRRTLLLLTENFVESEWCRWEFRMAHRTTLQDKINRLLVVIIENVPENIDEDLALYMQTTNYLRWGEKHFWDKLNYSLPRKDINRNVFPNPDDMPLSIVHKVSALR